jgi:beta-lactamase regulating signal transducer with metallopeptidase domain
MTEWLVDTLIATALLMAVVLALRAPVTRWFGARVAYALWLLPAARLFMPVLTRTIEVPAPVAQAEPAIALSPEALALLSSSTESAGPDWTAALLTVWLGGAALLFLWRIAAHLRECDEILDDAVDIAMIDGIRLVRARGITGPLAFGILRKCVAVPPGFYRDYSEREQELALAHEVSHHRSGDLPINFAAFLILCFHWFNPIAWYAWRAFRFDQEAACDARVLAQTEVEERPLYGRAVAKASSGRALLFASALDNPNSLKRRLKTMAMNDKSKFRRITGLAAIGVGLAVALPMTATVSYAVTQANGDTAIDRGDAEDGDDQHRRIVIQRHRADEHDEHADHDENSERHVYRFSRGDGEHMTDEEIEAMIPNREELMAMIPSEAEIRTMIPSEAELREMIPSEAEMREMIPDREELLAMIPDIETIEACHASGDAVHSEESTDPATGRQRMRLMICRDSLVANAQAAALGGLREARAEIAVEQDIAEGDRAEALARLDEQIERLSREAH